MLRHLITYYEYFEILTVTWKLFVGNQGSGGDTVGEPSSGETEGKKGTPPVRVTGDWAQIRLVGLEGVTPTPTCSVLPCLWVSSMHFFI
jgi:hypothetical protein